MKGNCIHCGKEHTWGRNSSQKYCSNTCQRAYQSANKIRLWLEEGGKPPAVGMLRRYLMSLKEGCWECGIIEWRGKPLTLDIEHCDGNGHNDSINNLKMLCPNCHSQTPTYKNKNHGNGRVERRERAARDYHRAHATIA